MEQKTRERMLKRLDEAALGYRLGARGGTRS
jgi:hypothetical protein